MTELMRPASLRRTAMITLVALSFLGGPTLAEDPLHVRIDRLIASANFGSLSESASDGDYLRRLYLDLTGSVPPVEIAREFLADTTADKRVAALDRLLESPQYVRHMSNALDVMLMERRAEKHVKRDEWQKYLYDSVAQNKPWDQLAREILGADGTDEKVRAATAFYLYRDVEPNLLTRDVGRMFFGMDLQCCQCHDHPLIDTYYQADYYGIFAFLNRGFLFTDKDKKVFYAEKAEGDVKFTSVFTEEQGQTRPRLPGGFQLPEPTFPQGEEYTVKPADKVRPVPKYSRRAKLAELAGSGANRAFNRNIVNRLWAHMMGQGLVSPVDLHHVHNAATHAELLDLLADEFVALKYDIKAMLRELALAGAYQRSLQMPGELAASAEAARQQVAALESERENAAARLDECEAAVEQQLTKLLEADQAEAAVIGENTQAQAAVDAAQKVADEAARKLSEAQGQLATKQDIAQAVAEAAAKAQQAAEKLPEEKQLAQAAGTFQNRATKLAAEVAAAEKSVADLTPPAKQTADALASASTAAADVATRLDQASQRVAAIRPLVTAAREQQRLLQLAVLDRDARLHDAGQLTEFGQLVAAATGSRNSLETTRSQLASSRQSMEKAKAELPARESELTAARNNSQQATDQLADSRGQLAAKQEAAALVGEVAAKAEVASQKLPDDTEVKQAAEQVKTRSVKLNEELAQLQTAVAQREQAAKTSAEQLAAAQQKLDDALGQIQTLEQSLPKLEAALPGLEAKSDADQVALSVKQNGLVERWSKRFFTSSLAALTPEQMAWSAMQATGMVDQQLAAAEAEVNKNLPVDADKPDDPKRLAQRARAREQFMYDKLKGNVATFVKLFGHADGQPQTDFFATVDQALFFANAGTLQSWLNPSGNNLTTRLNQLEDPQAIADEVYISILTRRPTVDESADVREYLASREKEKVAALKEMAWALITSAEFRFRH